MGPDVPKVFGPNSPEAQKVAQAFADFVGSPGTPRTRLGPVLGCKSREARPPSGRAGRLHGVRPDRLIGRFDALAASS
jgi:hypothetical protein